jgi:hypothetical protein
MDQDSAKQASADANVWDLLSARARRASDAQLALTAAAGVVGAVALIAVKPRAWAVLSGSAVCTAAFGLWGIADRSLQETVAITPLRRIAFRTIRGVTVVVGVLAFLTILFQLLFSILGPWKALGKPT